MRPIPTIIELQTKLSEDLKSKLNLPEAELKIVVESNGVVPEFDYQGILCEFDDVLTLATISDNGISGLWSSGTIDPSENVGNSVTVRL